MKLTIKDYGNLTKEEKIELLKNDVLFDLYKRMYYEARRKDELIRVLTEQLKEQEA